ncbi:MAG: phosphoglycerate kinase [Lachnospiraceae bacterium]|nr:phosphoglycerate kinase [Lachnospiraceae bacterium]
MLYGIRTLDELPLSGKTVLCRLDLNQPVDRAAGRLKSINRIEAAIPTVKELIAGGAKTVLLAHQGSDIEYKNFYSTKPHAEVLSRLLGQEVKWIDDVCGPAAREAIKALQPGEVLLLDNVRYVAEEQTLFERSLKLTHEQQAQTLLPQKLAPLAHYYVCDAFAAAHRDQPSLCGLEQLLPSAMGRLFEKEYGTISSIMDQPARPCVFILGGAKIADAFQMMETVLSRGIADEILTGGLVANIFLHAAGKKVGQGSLDFIEKEGYSAFYEKARTLIEHFGEQITLPSDLSWTEDGVRKEARLDDLPEDVAAVDIGCETAARYVQVILQAKTVFANGPMGVFEKPESEYGTRTVWETMAETEGFTVLGGGDSIAATEKYGLVEKMGYICTGGGALIRFLSGEELPVVKALRHGSLLPLAAEDRYHAE